MTKSPLTAKQQDELDQEITDSYLIEHEETTGIPVKLSEKIIAGLDDDEVAMSVLRRIKGRKTAFLFELDEFEDLNELMSRLRDEYGGGNFVIQGRRSNGNLAFNQGLDIEKPNKKEEPEPQQGGNFESILLAMNENSQRQSNETRDLMIQMNNKSAEASRDNMNMLVKMMEINKPQQQMGMTEIVAIMANIKEMTAQPAPDNPMELFIKGMEMGKETASGGDESILQTAIKSFAPPLASLAQLQTGTTPANPPQTPAPVHATPQTSNVGTGRDTPALPTATEQPKESPEMLEKIKLLNEMRPHINVLLRAASLDGDPEVYANYILDMIELEKIKSFLENEETYEQFFTMVPQAQPFKEWFDNCRVIVLHYLKEGEQPEETLENNVLNEADQGLRPVTPEGENPNNVSEGEQSTPQDIPGEASPAIDGDTIDTASANA